MVEVKKKLFSLGMRELFPSRIVNSCYFDTKNLSLHHELEEGVMPRKKIKELDGTMKKIILRKKLNILL